MDPTFSKMNINTRWALTDVFLIHIAKFNLWIMPSRNTANELKKTIMSVRKDRPHSPTSYPDFEPHITLASIQLETPLALSTIKNAIPKTQHAFLVKFKSVEVGDHYFRSVYISIVLDETLKNLRQSVHETLGVCSTTPQYPHISLVYISDEDDNNVVRERERYYDELRERQLIRDHDDHDDSGGIKLRTESGWLEGSMMTEIWVVKCVGPVETWEVLDKILL